VTGFTGSPTDQHAGATFTLTVRAVDAYWNLVPGVNYRIALTSTDGFANIPPETTLAIPSDFVRQMMEGIGLAGREAGLNAMLTRIKRHAAAALAA